MQTLIYILYAVMGTFLGAFLSILPGMHVLNFAGIGLFIYLAFPWDPIALAMVFIGMLIGYVMIGMIQMTYMGVPDDSTRYFAFPNQKYLMYGRGHEATILAGVGALGSMLIILAIAPAASWIFPIFRRLTTPHIHWILIGVVVYLLQADWPKDWGSRAKTRLGRLRDGWASLSASWLTFFLSLMLGFIILNVSVAPIERAFANLMPVVIGFFAIPALLLNMISRARIPPQNLGNNLYVSKKDIVRGTGAGFLGGTFAAYEPCITAGPGCKLAAHSTATSGDVQFMVSGAAGRYAYYIGAFFLFWVPLLHLTRGLMAWITTIVYQPTVESEFWLLIAGIAFATVFAFGLLMLVSKVIARMIHRISYFRLSLVVMSLVIGLVFGFFASPTYYPATILTVIFSSVAILLGIFATLSKIITKVRSKAGYLPFVVALIVLVLAFVWIEGLLVGSAGLAAGARGLVILATAAGLGTIPLTFRCMWTFTLLGFFFALFLNMAGLGAGIAVALGLYP